MLEHVLLCLKCRGRGHIVNDCEIREWQPVQKWMVSDTRMAMDFDDAWDDQAPTLCERCEMLDVVSLLKSLPPWQSQTELTDGIKQRQKPVRSLGITGSIQFWEDCCMCRCLFAIIEDPESEEQEVLLLPDWTMCRLAGELGIAMDTEEKRQYASCLVTVLLPSPEEIAYGTAVFAHRGDALCLLKDEQRTLHGRRTGHNIGLVHHWLDSCMKLHKSECAPALTEELKHIRLIDVEARQVVKYPEGCEYVALSYVWGGTAQPSYQLGSQLLDLPKTLEDAIAYTKALHRRYLWVDSICIDQSDTTHKRDQINRMSSIYSGACLTIITLAGTSAASGLYSQTCPQATCVVKGHRLVSLMPTLSRQINDSPWGSRAWTFQEGLLSPRCLFISSHQMYFDCNIMTCCESLDETQSWGHNLGITSKPANIDFVDWMRDKAGWGVLRNPLTADRLGQWGIKINIYCHRDLTHEEDAIDAFSGILSRLEIMYPKGFFYGLPMEDMNWALAWKSREPPTRRGLFPSWSWAEWKGPVWFGQPPDLEQTRRMPIGLQIFRLQDGRLDAMFESEYEEVTQHDPIDQPPCTLSFPLDPQSVSEEAERHLFIRGTCFEFALDFSRPQADAKPSIQLSYFEFPVQGVKCIIGIQGFDPEISSASGTGTFLLLARDTVWPGLTCHFLLLIRDRDGVFERGTALELHVPENELKVLADLKPQTRCIILT